jgi:hypothetical protein
MTWEQLQAYLKGKVFLIGLTFIDRSGKFIGQYQTHGTVLELTSDGLFKIERQDKSIFQIPYDKESISKAGKGEYREKASGEIITDPDFLMTWEIITDENDNLDEIKKHGYIPAK